MDINIQGEKLNLTGDMLARYNVPGPRYTSYPTAPEWSNDFGHTDFERALSASNEEGRPISIYMHLPFCEKLCLFCGCNVIISQNHDVALPYLRTLQDEITHAAAYFGRVRKVTQFHWGGGTPTYFTPEQLAELFTTVKHHFTFAADAELSIEVDPRTTTLKHLEMLRNLGFERISLGIQDFNPQVQEIVKRVQPYEKTKGLFEACRALRFESLNVDLIYGLPGQTAASFIDTVNKVIAMKPDRIAMFSYAHVPWIKKQQGALTRFMPSDMEKFEIFSAGIARFTEAGYQYIGMDHFAHPDDELCLAQRHRRLHRNFQGYSTGAGADLLGLGVTSISGIGRVYAQNQRNLTEYTAAIETGRLPVMRGIELTDDDVIRRDVIERLLCHCVLDKAELATQYEIDFDHYFADELGRLESLSADGLVEHTPDAIRVTPLGRIFLRNVGMVFDSYLQKTQDKPVFSRTL